MKFKIIGVYNDNDSVCKSRALLLMYLSNFDRGDYGDDGDDNKVDYTNDDNQTDDYDSASH